MSIDWSKAPEGATHWDTGIPGRVAGWMRLDGDTWYWWPVDGAKCDRKWFATGTTQPVESFIERPTQWSGEGLPPVGTVCEFHDPRAVIEWRECMVIAHDNALAIVNYKGNYFGLPHNRFRPLRTAEQIAAEDRETAITDIALIMGKDPARPFIRERAGILYDAGYRKQVKP